MDSPTIGLRVPPCYFRYSCYFGALGRGLFHLCQTFEVQRTQEIDRMYLGEWILVLVIAGGNWGGPATATFSDENACELALKNARDMKEGFGVTVRGFCTPKAVDTQR